MNSVRKGFLAAVLSCAVAIVPYLPVTATMAVVVTQSGCNTTWIQTALNDLPILVQIATTIAQIVGVAKGQNQVDPSVAAQIQSVAAQVQSDLTLVQNLVSSYNSADASAKPGILGNIDADLTAVQTNLSAILQAVHVNNPALQATIATSIGLAITTVLAIESLVPAPPAPTPAVMAVRRVAVRPATPKQLKAQFNQILAANGFSQYALN